MFLLARSLSASLRRVFRLCSSWCLLIAALLPGGPFALGQSQRLPSSIHPETSSAAEALLKTAASHVRQSQWDSAVELYLRAIQQFPEALTLADSIDRAEGDDGPVVSVFINVSEFAQHRLALLPAEALALYRNRIDGEARHLFERGRDQLDPVPLRRVVDSYFNSSYGDDAAELLADLAFQEGRFDEALGLYRRLIPASDTTFTASIYPDPQVDVACVAAKAILCREALGQRLDSRDLRDFAETYPENEGQLAGRRGKYVDILTAALNEDALRRPESYDSRWPTFAGAPTRTKELTEPVEPGEMLWSIPLRTPFESSENLTASPPRFGGDFGMPEDDFPSFFPVLEGDEVFLTDGRTVLSYPLEGTPEGMTAPSPSWRASLPISAPSAIRPTFGIDRHTLTIFNNRIYARLGPYGTDIQGRNLATAPSTAIVSFDRSRSDGPLWLRTADEVMAGPGQANQGALIGQVAFGGAPVVDDHGVYVALLKPGTQALTWVACLDPDSGQTRWVRFVCSGTSSTLNRVPGGRNRGLIVNPEMGHRLLTLGGSTIYYQTDLGATASIDARSGRMNWLASYPRRLQVPSGLASPGNHNPAVIHDDKVIVAPEDSDRIFAFDRSTGRLVWQADPGDQVTHILGVSSGKAVVTGNHVWTINVQNGEIQSRWPEGQTLEQGYGRGLTAGGEIYWPTRDTLYILDHATGRPTDRPPIPLREAFGCGGGNLVAADGYLLIAERNQLRIFCKPSRMLRYYRERIAAEPEEPKLHYRLARTAEALGDDQEALESLERVLDLASPSDRIDGRRLVDAARAERFKIYMKRAAQFSNAGDQQEASEQLEHAVTTAPDHRARLEAELALAEARHATGDSTGAVELLQSALIRPEVRQIDLPADDHRTLRAELLLVDRLRSLIRESGPERYAPFEIEASKLFQRGLNRGELRLLEEVVQRYPASQHVPEALEAIGTIAEGLGDWSDAARAYHQLLVSTTEDRHKAIGLLGLARCFEAVDLNADAREAYAMAEARYGDLNLEFSGVTQSVERYIAARLASAQGPTGNESDSLTPPLNLRKASRWPSDFAPLQVEAPTTVTPIGSSGPFLLSGAGQIRSIAIDNGELLWEAGFPQQPIWSGFAGGSLITAASDRIAGHDPTTGELRWEFFSQDDELGLGPADHQKEKQRGEAPLRSGVKTNSAGFHAFRLNANRLYFLRGGRELVCLDPSSGQSQWSYRTSSISIDPHLGLGLSRVVLQSRMPNATIVLDSRDGRTLGLYPQNDAVGPWRREPHAVSLDRVAIVPDSSTVVLTDLDSGRAIWEAREQSPLPSSPRPSPTDPLVLGDFERLFVLRGEILQRLDPTDGKVLWSKPLGRFRSDRRADSISIGGDAVYVLGSMGLGLAVSALALENGEPLWSVDLPGDLSETWGLVQTRDCVLVYRLGDSTPGILSTTPVMLHFLSRSSGKRVQRLVVEGVGAARQVKLHPNEIRIAGDQGLWRASGRKHDGRLETR